MRCPAGFCVANAEREFTKEALAIRVKRRFNSTDVVDALTDIFILRGPPEFIRSDNGAEFIAKKVRDWIGAFGAKTAFIAPGSPWENGYCESFNSRFRDELFNGEVFYTLREAQILIERWRHHYNTVRPPQRLALPPTGARKHDADRPEADHALTFKLDHPMGALQQSAAHEHFSAELDFAVTFWQALLPERRYLSGVNLPLRHGSTRTQKLGMGMSLFREQQKIE